MNNDDRNPHRLSEEILIRYGKLPTANISDAMGRRGGMSCDIYPVFQGARLCGPAYTVSNYTKDNLMTHYALKHCQPGDVLVLDSSSGKHGSGWGELMSLAAKVKGVGGIVIDGTVRDISELKEIKFPIFAMGIQAEGTVKVTQGKVNCPITCGNLSVSPGDLVVGDENGIVVVPLHIVDKTLPIAEAISEKEKDIRKRVLGGESLFDILRLEKYF